MSGIRSVVRRVNIRFILSLLPPYLQVAKCSDPVRQVHHRDGYCFSDRFMTRLWAFPYTIQYAHVDCSPPLDSRFALVARQGVTSKLEVMRYKNVSHSPYFKWMRG